MTVLVRSVSQPTRHVARPLRAARVTRRRRLTNHLATVLISGSFLLALVPLVWLLWTVISNGVGAVTRTGWFTASQRSLTFTDAGGGAYHAILGTVEQVGLCALISIPIALMLGVYLAEYGRGWFARLTTFMVDILTGLPSIVAALFVYAVFIGTLGGQRAGWLVSLALVMLMIPVVVRTTEEMLRIVPAQLREAAYALGIPKWKTIVRVVVPTALNGIITGVVLGLARVAGESAPLLILVGYTPNTNADLFAGPQGALPAMINNEALNFTTRGTYVLGANGEREMVHNFAVDRMWGAALTLIVIVMGLNLLARFIGRRRPIPS